MRVSSCKNVLLFVYLFFFQIEVYDETTSRKKQLTQEKRTTFKYSCHFYFSFSFFLCVCVCLCLISSFWMTFLFFFRLSSLILSSSFSLVCVCFSFVVGQSKKQKKRKKTTKDTKWKQLEKEILCLIVSCILAASCSFLLLVSVSKLSI